MPLLRKQPTLYHYGIKGQKWGVRNYENYDGTLTEAGKARYYGTTGGLVSKFPSKLEDRDLSKLTTKELQDIVNRYNAEKNYKKVYDETNHPIMTEVKKQFAKFGGLALNTIVMAKFLLIGKEQFNKLF